MFVSAVVFVDNQIFSLSDQVKQQLVYLPMIFEDAHGLWDVQEEVVDAHQDPDHRSCQHHCHDRSSPSHEHADLIQLRGIVGDGHPTMRLRAAVVSVEHPKRPKLSREEIAELVEYLSHE